LTHPPKDVRMTDDTNDKTVGFRKYGTPVPARRGDAPDSTPRGEDESGEGTAPTPRKGESEGSRLPTGS
jgi:hypothetical protein